MCRSVSAEFRNSENLFKGFAFAAAVDNLPATDKSRLCEDPQHPYIVEVGIDPEGSDSAFAGEAFRLPEEFAPDAMPQCLVGYGQPMYGHIVALGESFPVEGVVSRFAAEDDCPVGDDGRIPGSVVPDDYMAVPMLQIRFDMLGCGVSVLPLEASGCGHTALGLADDLQDARDVGRGCRPEKELFHGRIHRFRVSGRRRIRRRGADPDCKGTKRSSDVILSLFLSDFLSQVVSICRDL